MPEPYKTAFLSILEKKKQENYVFFTEKQIDVQGATFRYLECNIDFEILKCAMDLAREKSKFTMAPNQASIPRDDLTKLQKSAQGILAEMFIHFLLLQRYGLTVKRFDLERESFVYSKDEYDLKIFVNPKWYEVESRSSNIHHAQIRRFIEQDVIIGPYGNKVKQEDELADFHFRPIYLPEFIPIKCKSNGCFYNSDMFNGNIKLIITGMATKDDFIRYGRRATLGQKGTSYLVVDVLKVGDIESMDNKIANLKRSAN